MSAYCLLFIICLFASVFFAMLLYKPQGASNQYGNGDPYWIPQFYPPIFSVPWNVPGEPQRSPSPQNQKNRQKAQNHWVKVDNATNETPCPPTHLRNFICVNKRNSEDSIRVLQYNVLAETYNAPDRYSYCPEWALKWSYRGKNLLNEILAYQPDIITLQEVDMYAWFEEQLQKMGLKEFIDKGQWENQMEWLFFTMLAGFDCAIFTTSITTLLNHSQHATILTLLDIKRIILPSLHC